MPIELPTELWLRIAHFIPDDGLSSLFRVSRLFYEFSRDRKYRHLVLDDDSPSALVARLEQIEKDSVISRMVNSLSIYPRAIRSACLRSGRSDKKVLSKANHRDWPASFRLGTSKCPVPEDITLADRLLTGISGLQGVRDLYIEWRMASPPEMPFCFPFLTALWPSLGQGLTSLTLDMGLDYVCHLVERISGLESIQSLGLNIGPYALGSIKLDEAAKHQENLAKFINRVSPTLQSLSISSIDHLRLCVLYSHLSHFPRLRYLSLHIPFDRQHLDDVKGINLFLQSHTGIRNLSLIPKYCCKHYNTLWKAVVTSWADPDEWIRQVFAGVKFEELGNLEVGLNTVGGHHRVLQATQHIGNVVSNLECLTITGVLTSVEDLDLILGPFSRNGNAPPKKVVLEVHVLNRLVLESIAKTLPNLETLDLTYRWINSAGNCDQGSFARDMQGRFYNEWNLRNFFVRCSHSNDKGRWLSQLAIARSIPNLFRGLK